jgi:cell division topological specificity factor
MIMSFLDRLFGRKPASASNAKERLQLVLIHDRTDLSPAALEEMKDDLIEAISRHIDIDPSTVRIELATEGRSQRLVADIPIRNATSRRRAG